MRIAERLSLMGKEADAQAIFKMITVFHAGEDKLAGYVDEVKAGIIIRKQAQPQG
ncbi:Transcriptional regulator [Pseudomonas syringae pv. actinidiae]|uniref:Transcriptional regulator n=2 Tax=Pseudomonas syringae TaxID=317 RepID=A0A2V0Q8J2_PSESF|nr:Transcriptional regulator [Pseudomonas syringae pv. actinidiae]